MDLKKKTIEYRKIDVKNLEIRSSDNGDMIVEGYATTFNDPYVLWRDGDYTVMEQVDPDAFNGADMKDVIMQYDHEGRVFARIRNKTLEVVPDGHGLFVRAFLGGTELGRQLYEEIKGGYTDRMSFGFTVSADERKEEKDADGKITVTRTIKQIGKLYDVSAVSIPANDATEISARSFADGVIREAMEEAHAIEVRRQNIQKIKILIDLED